MAKLFLKNGKKLEGSSILVPSLQYLQMDHNGSDQQKTHRNIRGTEIWNLLQYIFNTFLVVGLTNIIKF